MERSNEEGMSLLSWGPHMLDARPALLSAQRKDIRSASTFSTCARLRSLVCTAGYAYTPTIHDSRALLIGKLLVLCARC